MVIGVLGGMGTAGSAVVAELEQRGHAVRVLSRRTGFDATVPDRVAEVLGGVDVIIDCLQPSKTDGKSSRALLVDGVRATLGVAEAAGVGHYVCLSIVGIDRFSIPYYRAKVEQERAVLDGPVPGSIVRATQFPELLDRVWEATRRFGVIPAPRGVAAPITPAEAAVVLVDAAESMPGAQPRREVRGRETIELGSLAREWKRRHGSRRPVVPLPVLGGALKAIADGALVGGAARVPSGLPRG
ncbi:MAG: hypothetical protein Q7T55_04620 [Solirubrobacteraceae bacterium]|nr:hypothetical protein [Solirubrobacteraceae bacterium]